MTVTLLCPPLMARDVESLHSQHPEPNRDVQHLLGSLAHLATW
jgi:hypothetical protein